MVEGEVDHRDSLLSDQERAAHDTMFPCVSRAACPKLVLELRAPRRVWRAVGHVGGREVSGVLQAGRADPADRTSTGPVLARALRILDAFTDRRPAMTLSELARHSGLPVSTVHRMIAELVSWGALERGEDGRYWIGLRLWEVGALAPRGQGLRERALPYLEDLFQVTQENVQLAVREGMELVFVERIGGTGAVPVLTRVGGRFALTATGVGLVLLAYAPPDVQDEVLCAPIPRYTRHTVTDPARLRQMLADVRTTGFSISDRQVTDDAVSVGAPVRDTRGQVVAAVSLVVRFGTTAPHQLSALVCTSARAISRALSTPSPTRSQL